jgi:hypothetical protein
MKLMARGQVFEEVGGKGAQREVRAIVKERGRMMNDTMRTEKCFTSC